MTLFTETPYQTLFKLSEETTKSTAELATTQLPTWNYLMESKPT